MKLSKRKTAAIVLLATLGVTAAIGGYTLMRTFFEEVVRSGGRLIVPPSLDVTPSYLRWGNLWLDEEQVVSEQTVTVRNRGVVPLRLQAFPVAETEFPEWFKQDEFWLFGWTADGYVLAKGETIETTFKLLVLAEKTAMGALQRNSTESDFYFDVKIEAGDWNEGETFVHYCSEADYDAAELIAENRSLSMVKGVHVAVNLKDPGSFDPVYDLNHPICIGGYAANPYVAHYFSEYKIEKGRWVGGSGISEDGQSVVATKTRASGYNITGVFGIDESYSAAKAYVGYVPEPKASYMLTIAGSVNGTTDPEAGSYSYTEGAVASVTAIPDVGYALDCWLRDSVDVGSANPLKVTMDTNHSVMCMFKEYVPAGAELLILPETQTWPTDTAFEVSIEIKDVENLYAWELRIYFDVAALNVTRAFYPDGHFLTKPNFEVPVVIDYEEGSVLLAVIRMGDVPGCSGDGVLAKIEFKTLAKGTTTLRLEVADLLDKEGDNILDFTTKDATVVIS